MHLGAALPSVSEVMPADVPSVAASDDRTHGGASLDLAGLLISVVSDKTGYPAEMLTLEMDLEADLGVDSIKRVEILSAVREAEPNLPEVDAGALASLQTLAQIVSHLTQQQGPAVSRPGRHVVMLVDAPETGLGLAGLGNGPIQIVDDGWGVSDALVKQMGERGWDASKVQVVSGHPHGVIFLGAIGRDLGRADSVRVHEAAFAAIRHVAPQMMEGKGFFVAAQDTGGDFGLSGGAGERAWLGGVSALVKTANIEGSAPCKSIDISVDGRSADAVASSILGELLRGGPEVEVALSDSGRKTVGTRVEPAVAGEPLLGKQDVVVASGGARGVTAETMIALARDTGARFALLGRTALTPEPTVCQGVDGDMQLKRVLLQDTMARGEKVSPAALGKQVKAILAGREVRRTLKAIDAAGGQGMYITADVTDADSVAKALDGVRDAWGDITALVHGAGVLADKLLAEKTAEQFAFVFRTKVLGLQALLDATHDDPLRAIVMFSSVAARGGNMGQGDYAAANEVLNKVAAAERHRRGDGCVVKSLGWGPWDGGMVTPELKRHFQSLGVEVISLQGGSALLVEELQSGQEDQIEIVVGSEPDESALVGRKVREVCLGVRVDGRTCPELDGHRVKGTVVVPAVMAAEWLVRAAKAVRPHLAVSEVRDLQVKRGIRLSRFDLHGADLTVRAKQLENGKGSTIAAELYDESGKLCYTATVRMEDEAPRARRAPNIPVLGAWDGRVVYDGDVVFHGRQFQVIRRVDGVSSDGAVAALEGIESQGWRADAWWSDPALLDGALQLGLIWVERVLAGASLPTGVGSLRVYRQGPIAGSVTAVLLAGEVRGDVARYDVALVDQEGTVVAELKGVTHHRLPGVKSARDWSSSASA
jgi:acyl carrier protein